MAITILGRVKSGLGRGKYFMGQKEYRKQFIKKLGIDPYFGTLNLSLSEAYARKLEKLKSKRIIVKGFKRGKRKFGSVVCYNAEISGIKCALVQPKLSKHINTAELISEKKLRSALKLKDGNAVRVMLK